MTIFTKPQIKLMDSLYTKIENPTSFDSKFSINNSKCLKKYKRYYQLALILMRTRVLFAVDVQDIFLINSVYSKPVFHVYSYGDLFNPFFGTTLTYSQLKKVFNVFNSLDKFKLEDATKGYILHRSDK